MIGNWPNTERAMFEKLLMGAMVTGWLGAMAVLIRYEPEKAVLFARVFTATCIGIARLVGVA